MIIFYFQNFLFVAWSINLEEELLSCFCCSFEKMLCLCLSNSACNHTSKMNSSIFGDFPASVNISKKIFILYKIRLQGPGRVERADFKTNLCRGEFTLESRAYRIMLVMLLSEYFTVTLATDIYYFGYHFWYFNGFLLWSSNKISKMYHSHI